MTQNRQTLVTPAHDTSQKGSRQNEPTKELTRHAPSWGTASASDVLRGLAERHRAAITAAYKRLGGRFTTWAYEDWIRLECAIFGVENEIEHKGAARGVSDVEPVLSMRKRRVALEALVGDERPMLVHRVAAVWP